MNFSITRNGVDAKHLCDINEKTKTVSTTENGLVFDFANMSGWTFKTGTFCTFITDFGCTFKTGATFKTGSYYHPTAFETGSYCTFTTGYGCTFTTGGESVVVRRDVFEVIQLEANKTIKLNDYQVSGYTEVKQTKSITLELTEEQIESLKKQGIMG